MSEYLDRQLPIELAEDELRYVRPQNFVGVTKEYGWGASVEEAVDDNHYKVRYVMSRVVSVEFDDGDVSDLKDKIGIIDEYGETIENYSLWTEDVRVWRARQDRTKSSPRSESKRLFFEFEGFPTDETMDVIENLLTVLA